LIDHLLKGTLNSAIDYRFKSGLFGGHIEAR